jgi:hypothetical protein
MDPTMKLAFSEYVLTLNISKIYGILNRNVYIL